MIRYLSNTIHVRECLSRQCLFIVFIVYFLNLGKNELKYSVGEYLLIDLYLAPCIMLLNQLIENKLLESLFLRLLSMMIEYIMMRYCCLSMIIFIISNPNVIIAVCYAAVMIHYHVHMIHWHHFQSKQESTSIINMIIALRTIHRIISKIQMKTAAISNNKEYGTYTTTLSIDTPQWEATKCGHNSDNNHNNNNNESSNTIIASKERKTLTALAAESDFSTITAWIIMLLSYYAADIGSTIAVSTTITIAAIITHPTKIINRIISKIARRENEFYIFFVFTINIVYCIHYQSKPESESMVNVIIIAIIAIVTILSTIQIETVFIKKSKMIGSNTKEYDTVTMAESNDRQ